MVDWLYLIKMEEQGQLLDFWSFPASSTSEHAHSDLCWKKKRDFFSNRFYFTEDACRLNSAAAWLDRVAPVCSVLVGKSCLWASYNVLFTLYQRYRCSCLHCTYCSLVLDQLLLTSLCSTWAQTCSVFKTFPRKDKNLMFAENQTLSSDLRPHTLPRFCTGASRVKPVDAECSRKKWLYKTNRLTWTCTLLCTVAKTVQISPYHLSIFQWGYSRVDHGSWALSSKFI